MKVMVAGGAGYIGSHAVKMLIETGHEVVVVDNLYRGHSSAVNKKAMFVEGDILDTDLLVKVLEEFGVEGVMHFSALASVGESVDQPLDYYKNNTAGTISLLQAMQKVGVKKLVFSSTCATYGEPDTMPLVETMPQSPINPYGWSKLMVERILLDYAASDPTFAFVAPRYFNVAGSAMDTSIGEDHEPETHLIPVIIEAALGRRESITVFGTDYPTPDGTCIRDYIHVEDLCRAHIMALEKMQPGWGKFMNLGIGQGYSVKEVIDATKRVTGVDFKVVIGERRPGDPPTLYANAALAKKELGWVAEITNLDKIIDSAWRWFKDHPDGYGD